jgi:hypothetical protein
MVNNDPTLLRLHAFQPAPQPLPENRKIPGPRYQLELVKTQIEDPNEILVVTRDCPADLRDLRWANPEVFELLQSTVPGDYRDSEWCATGRNYAIDCDSYLLFAERRTGRRVDSDSGIPVFLKFGFRQNSGLILVISCHKG